MSTPETDPQSDTETTAALSGRTGWLVVAVLFVSAIVAPLLLYWAGQTGDLQALGLGFKDTYLAIPMLPAILLGAIGIWTALRYR